MCVSHQHAAHTFPFPLTFTKKASLSWLIRARVRKLQACARIASGRSCWVHPYHSKRRRTALFLPLPPSIHYHVPNRRPSIGLDLSASLIAPLGGGIAS